MWRKAYLLVWSGSWGRGGCPSGCGVVNGGLWWPEGALEVSVCCCCTECCCCCLHLRPRLSVWRGGESFWWWRGGARWSETAAGVAVFRERETRSGREKGCNGEPFLFFFLLLSFLLLSVFTSLFFCFKTSFLLLFSSLCFPSFLPKLSPLACLKTPRLFQFPPPFTCNLTPAFIVKNGNPSAAHCVQPWVAVVHAGSVPALFRWLNSAVTRDDCGRERKIQFGPSIFNWFDRTPNWF